MTKTGATFDEEVSKLADRIVEFGDKVGEGLEYFIKRTDEVESSIPEPTRESRRESVKALKNSIEVYKKFENFSVRTLSQFDSYLLEIKGLHDRAPEESKPELVEMFNEVNSGKSLILERKLDAEKKRYEADLIMRKIKRGGGGGFLYLSCSL